jgi:filamentous hemagglutinin
LTLFLHGGQAVYKKGRTYITRDIGGHHKDGAWKMADSVRNLKSKKLEMVHTIMIFLKG